MVDDQKYSKFVAAITREANKKREAMTRETEEYIEQGVKKAEKDILEDSYRQIQRKLAVFHEDVGRELSHNELEIRKQLFVRREEIKNEIFEKAKQTVLAFSASVAYETFLTRSAEQIVKEFETPSRLIVYLRAQDEQYKPAIEKALGASCEFIFDDTILLGGIKVKDNSIKIDDTLDTRLSAQNEWFEENSGLTIE